MEAQEDSQGLTMCARIRLGAQVELGDYSAPAQKLAP